MAFAKFQENRFRIDGEIAENHAILVNLTASIYSFSIYFISRLHHCYFGSNTCVLRSTFTICCLKLWVKILIRKLSGPKAKIGLAPWHTSNYGYNCSGPSERLNHSFADWQ